MSASQPVTECLQGYFARQSEGLVAVYLYGSIARGTAHPDSDIDLALLCAESPEPGVSGIHSRVEDDLERALGRSVQAIVLNAAAPDLVHRVLRDGILIHEADASGRIAFEVSLRREYLDLLPVLHEYRRVRFVTDAELVEKKLAAIETYVRELETLAEPAILRSDTKEERFIAHNFTAHDTGSPRHRFPHRLG
ncbi:MAG: type VII toxin-antitoxin system MntA family adenylyltransferase antitoxin [Gemmatimonadota bacterium]